jgi:Xaa-Pro aminopeptidase
VVICHVLLTMEECFLCINEAKVTDQIKNELANDGVSVIPYEKISEKLSALGKQHSIVFDPVKTSISLYNKISNEVKKVEDINITTKFKAVKNDKELENLRKCMINDGVALVKLIKWLKENIDKEPITEITVDEKLLELRKEQQYFVSPSFDSIIGYKENAAMMHYKALPESAKVLEREGFLLVDSGGQYYNGTTDTTRTIALGKLTDEEKKDFTLVLKGNIALSNIKFLYGATGSNLDVIARQPLWQHGIDYKCGTGHGIGFFLNVHEGPQRIAIAQNDVKMEKNMLITNEPGIYKEGRHGIRTENVLIVKEDIKTEFGQFMSFEDITLCPIDLDGIMSEMLNDVERTWLNNYHKKVFDLLSSALDDEEKVWLKNETREI